MRLLLLLSIMVIALIVISEAVHPVASVTALKLGKTKAVKTALAKKVALTKLLTLKKKLQLKKKLALKKKALLKAKALKAAKAKKIGYATKLGPIGFAAGGSFLG